MLEDEEVQVLERCVRVEWKNPWQWEAPWRQVEEALYCLSEPDVPAFCDLSAEIMAKRFVLAPPRELATVLHGCRMLGDLSMGKFKWPEIAHCVEWESEQPPWDLLRRQLRRTACYRLAETLSTLARDGDGQRPVDQELMASWMKGLLHCWDPTAAKMNEAIDAWARFDERITRASREELTRVFQKLSGGPLPLDADGQPDMKRASGDEVFEALEELFLSRR